MDFKGFPQMLDKLTHTKCCSTWSCPCEGLRPSRPGNSSSACLTRYKAGGLWAPCGARLSGNSLPYAALPLLSDTDAQMPVAFDKCTKQFWVPTACWIHPGRENCQVALLPAGSCPWLLPRVGSPKSVPACQIVGGKMSSSMWPSPPPPMGQAS